MSKIRHCLLISLIAMHGMTFISCGEDKIVSSVSSPSTFLRTLDLGTSDRFETVIESPDGSIVAGGSVALMTIDSSGPSPDTTIEYKGLLVKYSSSGDTVWTCSFGEDNFLETINAIVPAWDGGYVGVGRSSPMGPGSSNYVQKVLEHGVADWWNKSSHSPWDNLSEVISGPNNNYVIAGRASGSRGPSRLFVQMTDVTGAMIWDTTFQITDTSLNLAAIKLTLNNEIMLLSSLSPGDGSGQGFHLLKLNQDGDSLFAAKVPLTGYYYFIDINFPSEDQIKLLGSMSGVNQFACFMMSTDSIGVIQTSRFYHRSEYFWIRDASFTSDGGGIFCGYYDKGQREFAGLLIKLDAQGNFLWEQKFEDANASIELNSVVEYSGGGYVISGISESVVGRNTDFLLIKTDRNGNLSDN